MHLLCHSESSIHMQLSEYAYLFIWTKHPGTPGQLSYQLLTGDWSSCTGFEYLYCMSQEIQASHANNHSTISSVVFTFLEQVDGQWGKWNPWSSCSVTCGAGVKSRSRLCDNPSPKHGGASCPGDGYERANCKDADCKPGMILLFGDILFIWIATFTFHPNL